MAAAPPLKAFERRMMTLIVDEIAGWSKNPGRKLGSVITGPHHEFRALGFNGLPRGMDDADHAYRVHPLKEQFTICAERNALRNAAAVGIDVRGCTLHVCWCPCEKCAEAIVEAGIAKVVAVASGMESAHPRWGMSSALEILERGGVELSWHDTDEPKYRDLMNRLPDTPPVPSGSTDWDARFLALARHASGWRPAGTGEVLVRRPMRQGEEADKIVRALGCTTKEGGGALDNAARLGLSAAGCTLYCDGLPNVDSFSREGLAALALPKSLLVSPRGKTWRKTTRTGADCPVILPVAERADRPHYIAAHDV